MKFAICQELFEGWDWPRQCRFIAELGYTGVEVAPFSFASDIRQLTSDQRRTIRQQAEDQGLTILGLHWLLAKTQGMHITSADRAQRLAAADYLRALTDACADLGGSIMVFGSPAQRNLAEGTPVEVGMERAAEVFASVAPTLAERQVTLCLEPLTPLETNFLNTCAATAELINRLNHPQIQLHQDVKAMLSEATPIPELIHQFAPLTKHFHVNDSNLLGPGMGATEYRPILEALQQVRYAGWVSVEVFDYRPGAEKIARDSLTYLQRVLAELGSQP